MEHGCRMRFLTPAYSFRERGGVGGLWETDGRTKHRGKQRKTHHVLHVKYFNTITSQVNFFAPKHLMNY